MNRCYSFVVSFLSQFVCNGPLNQYKIFQRLPQLIDGNYKFYVLFIFVFILFRSRSSTPSNIGSPQSQSSQQQTNLLNSSATLLYRQQEIPVRNCSDLIRNLAAKYNNGNPNE